MKNSNRSILDDVLGEQRYKQPINQKKKGNSNESEVCKWLHKWTGEKFIRTPASGGRRLQNNDMFIGDVVGENQDFKFMFTVETKHYAKLGLKSMKGVLRANAKVYTFWQQAKSDAERGKKRPLLLVRENGMPKGTWIVFIESDAVLELAWYFDVNIIVEGEKYGIVGINSNDFLKIPYDKFAEPQKITNFTARNKSL